MQKKIVDNLLDIYGDRCPICGVQLSKENISIDHIIPRTLGGTTDLSNLRLLCVECNKKSANLSMSGYEFENYIFEIISIIQIQMLRLGKIEDTPQT